ncbi:phosphatase PAP2 family protein [Roseibium marinum]|uniref:phosphatase PAP2 family protein n=1 Tax=Roseibium marinum TaxID=281252 RepID=UPI000CD24B94|nr:phosphatase PAP2 family protein [Roseibium marinum]
MSSRQEDKSETGASPDDGTTQTAEPVTGRSDRDEERVLIVTGFCVVVFTLTAMAVGSGVSVNVDREVLLWFRSAEDTANAWGPAWFEEAAAEVTTLGGYTILSIVVFLTAVSLFLLRRKTAAVFLLSAVVSGSLLSSLAKLFFSRPRPDLVVHMDLTFTSSFPSAHAMVSTFTWLTLAAIATRFVPRRAMRVFVVASAVTIAVLVGLSRVYLGVHWPSDVLAGWAFGGAWAGICWLLANWLGRRLPRHEEFGNADARTDTTETAR